MIYIHNDWDRIVYPEKNGSSHLKIIVGYPIPENKIEVLLRFADGYETTSIIVKNSPEQNYDLSFLEYFPHIKGFSLTAYEFTNFSQFEYIPHDIEWLRIDASKSQKLSLSFLKRFNKLKSLSIEKHKKDIEVVSDLNTLEKLAIRSITMPDLKFAGKAEKLKSLEVRLGGTKNLDVLTYFEKLEYLELWAINKISNIDSIADTLNLKEIFLDQLSNVENVKSFKHLSSLKKLKLCRMKRLKSLEWLADAPTLQELSITQTSHLDIEAFKPLTRLTSLKAADIYIGRKHSLEVREMLAVPEIDYESS